MSEDGGVDAHAPEPTEAVPQTRRARAADEAAAHSREADAAAATISSITTTTAPTGPELQAPEADAVPPVHVPPRPPLPQAPASIEPPTPDVAVVNADASMPGVHRGGFARLPTAPIELAPAPPSLPEPQPELRWLMPEPAAPTSGMAAWALGFSIVGLAVSFVVGWGFPIGLVGIISAIIALRRPLESRRVAVWAIVLGLLSLVYSAGWLMFAASRTSIFG